MSTCIPGSAAGSEPQLQVLAQKYGLRRCMTNFGLVGMQPQTAVGEHCRCQATRPYGSFPRGTQYDEIVSVTDGRDTCRRQDTIERMQVEIGKQGRQRGALRNSATGWRKGTQPDPDEGEK